MSTPNAITFSGSLSCAIPGTTPNPIGLSFTNLQFAVAGSNYIQQTVSIGTSAQALDLGPVTAPHWAVFQNLDNTNYVQIFNGASGAVLLRLLPGEVFIGPLDPGCVPYAKANTAAIQLAYLIIAA